MKPTLITYKGKTQSLTAWSKEGGMSSGALNSRLKRGWSFERAISEPAKDQSRLYEYRGKMYTVEELALLHGGISKSAMRMRLMTHTPEEAMAMPNMHPTRKARISEEQQKKIFKPKPKEADKTQCKKCKYADKDYDCCYALVTSRCRKFISPPSPHCTVFVKGKSVVRQAALKRMGKVNE